MPSLTQGQSVVLTVGSDSTLCIQNPGGSATVESPVGTVIFRGGQANALIDVRSGSVQITANTGGLYYELNGDPVNGRAVVQDQITGAVTNAAGAQILPVQRQLILNAASSGTDSGWLPISPAPERFVYQLTTGSTSTGFTVDISADGSTSLGQAFTGTWASSTTAYITGLISYSNPLARFFRVTVTSGGPLSMARGA